MYRIKPIISSFSSSSSSSLRGSSETLSLSLSLFMSRARLRACTCARRRRRRRAHPRRRCSSIFYAKNPSLPPFAFAVLINLCLCFVVAPNSLQKSPITCECNEIALPLNWLNRFTPINGRTKTTRGANRPPSLTLPMATIFFCAKPLLD